MLGFATPFHQASLYAAGARGRFGQKSHKMRFFVFFGCEALFDKHYLAARPDFVR
jgi:hypothetical protein